MTEQMTDRQLTLQEQLLLLSLNDETGIFEGPYISYGMNAAAIVELLLQDRIAIQGERLTLKNSASTGDTALDSGLNRFAVTPRPHDIAFWVRCLYPDVNAAKETLMANLVQRGILRPDDGHFLWVFHLSAYPTADPAPEKHLHKVIQAAITQDGWVDQRTIALIALLQGCQSLDLVLPKGVRTRYKERIQALCDSDPIARAVGRTLAKVVEQDNPSTFTTAVVGAM